MCKQDTEAAVTLVICLGYRGAGFSGFAEQEGRRTVACEMRRALETLFRREVDFVCAGRTDAGVHALAQYISVQLTKEESSLSYHRLMAALTALTPDDISIRALYRAPLGFSARFDALARHYRYHIFCGNIRPIFAWEFAWWLRSANILDIDAMNKAAEHLIGEHDFMSFCKGVSAHKLLAEERSTSRYISEAHVLRVDMPSETAYSENLIAFDICGNAFLHNMVRIIVGSLVEVGRGHKDAEWFLRVLRAKDRRAAGPTAPALGLCFMQVDYPRALLKPW